MNLVGKIFVFLVFIMSVVFVIMQMAVFVTQKNWKLALDNPPETATPDQPLGLVHQLKNKEAEVQAAEAENAKLQKTIDNERARHVQALAALETEKFEREKTIAALETQLAGIEVERRAALGEIDSLTTIIAGLQAEIDGSDDKAGLRAMIAKVRADRDAIYEKALRLTDEVNQAQGDVWRLTEMKKTLEQQLAQGIAVLRDHGLNINSPSRTDPPPPLNGLVNKVSTTGQLIEVTVGYDDGLRKDHTMEVFNDKRYLGRMKVIETKPDSAVGRMEILNGRIQRGDRVATKLKVG
jgi:hypothetical protein